MLITTVKDNENGILLYFSGESRIAWLEGRELFAK